MSSASEEVQRILSVIKKRDPDQIEFYEAAQEIISSLIPVFEKEPMYLDVVERLIEPERVIQFRVPWIDDKGKLVVNRGYRIQFSSAIGPYKGGLRFHPSVNLSILKFLAFEQTFKNSLTGLPLGGGKGGSDFDPKGRTDNEVMRFCQSFMTELFRFIGHNVDIPAGDIGVGSREIGYLFGQYKRISNEFTGTLTGKSIEFGGSLLRPEATGYGVVWFLSEMLTHMRNEDLAGKRVLVSGSGNVAQYCVEMLIKMKALPLTMSDSDGVIYEENGFTTEQLAIVLDLKNNKRARINEYLKYSSTAKFIEKEKPWSHFQADIALPCATQNEINEDDAKSLKENGIYLVCEGANMPSTQKAIEYYQRNNILYGPAKASNAGGVACSGLEMSQNSIRKNWTSEEVRLELHGIMKKIFKDCYETSEKYGQKGNLQLGANATGFLKVAKAMRFEGYV